MDTVLIQLTTPKTMKLLQELEDLHLLRVLKKNISSDIKLSDKYAGKLSSDIAEDLQKHIEQSRNEWERIMQ
jgi:CMP-2-keto-3-deoxyoctulosonic acid synthetase